MRVLVTGGRTFNDRDWLWAGLDLLHARIPISEIIEGGAPGADVRAHEWAGRRGVPCRTCNADWEKYGKSAGYIRNAQMADLKPNLVLATPGGKGTANMVEIARKRGIGVVMLESLPIAREGGPRRPPSELVIDA